MFSDLQAFTDSLHDLPPANEAWRDMARERQRQLTKPAGSLGRLEEAAIFLAGWGNHPAPAAECARVVVFAGNHGVTAQGVSPFPPEVTEQMVANFARGGAAINAIAGAGNVGLEVVPLSLARPTGDISREPAMSENGLLEALNAGAAVVEKGGDLIALGEMGIGNTTIAAALSAAALGGSGADWAGPGTGLAPEGVSLKSRIVDQALAIHSRSTVSASETLRCLGGRETAAIAGAIVAARQRSMPVVLDGYVVTASLAPLFRDNAAILDHCIAGHCSAEPGHRRLLDRLGLKPLLDLEMRLGEGTGATLAVSLLRAAAASHNQMATFAEARVANRGENET